MPEWGSRTPAADGGVRPPVEGGPALSGTEPVLSWELNHSVPPERRCSSRTFRYGYLVTT